MSFSNTVANTHYPLCVEWYLPRAPQAQEHLLIGDETYYTLDHWKIRAKFLQLSLTDPFIQPFMAIAAIVAEVAMGVLNGLLSPFSGNPRQLLECARLIAHASTIPFALIALQAVALLGIASPHYARHYYTKIEDYIYHQLASEQGLFFKFTSQAFGPVKNVNDYQRLLEREAANPNGSGGFCHFLKQAFTHSDQTASLVPSSRALAIEITSRMDPLVAPEAPPIRVLEAGAGSGSFTEEVLRKLRPQDHFDIVELDPGFCDILRGLTTGRANVTVHPATSILDFNADKYDVIVSGVPLHALNSPSFVENIYRKYIALAKDDGVISQVEYMGLPKIGTFVFCGEQRTKHLEILNIKQRFTEQQPTTIAPVYWNFPPAQILHISARPHAPSQEPLPV